MLYYRRTTRLNPISDWGHAMFADNIDKIEGYGKYLWSIDSKHCIPISKLRSEIIKKWKYDQKHGFEGDFGGQVSPRSEYYKISPETIADSFDPEDIVDHADAWDSDLMVWFWERIAYPKNIMAISTYDGAICFDTSLINRMEIED